MSMKWDITFADPWFFLLLGLIPLLVIWYIFRNRKNAPPISFSSTSVMAGLPKTFRQRTRFIPFVLRLLALTVLVAAMARPQGHIGYEEVRKEGIDIVLAMDVSVSMLARDFKANRLDASKRIAKEFINGRPDDRFGLVIFSGESATRSALTTDRPRLLKKIDEMQTGILPDGTAIGMGLATAVSRIRMSEAKSKVVILLTDGVNNAGTVSPTTAAEIAKTYGVRVYTIGVGTIGKAESPVAKSPAGGYIFEYIDVEIDEGLLQNIAEMTGGKYFRANNEEKMRAIYDEIDQLEKTRIEVTQFENKPDKFWWFVVAAGIFYVVEILLRLFIYRTIP